MEKIWIRDGKIRIRDKHPGSTTQVFMLFTFRSKGEKRLLSSSSQEDEEQDKRRKVTGTGTCIVAMSASSSVPDPGFGPPGSESGFICALAPDPSINKQNNEEKP
jgi:hypothetical protein